MHGKHWRRVESWSEKIRQWAEGRNTGVLPFSLTSSPLLLSHDFVHWHSHSSFLPVLQRLLSYPGPSFMLCFLPRCSLITLLMMDSLTFPVSTWYFIYSRSWHPVSCISPTNSVLALFKFPLWHWIISTLSVCLLTWLAIYILKNVFSYFGSISSTKI